MQLIETKTAPNPRRVRIFLFEKGIVVPTENRDLGSLKSADFTKINPEQRVPVLVLDDGTAICETVAICRYFEEIHPEPALMGRGATGRAVVEMWQRRVELGFFAHVAAAFRHKHSSMAALEVPQIPEWGEANKPKALEALAKFNAQLADTRFLAGDDYSIADITLMVAADFMKPARIARPDGLGHFDRWYAEVSARPSAAA
ncbi:MAG: glutathione S-transferase [Hyphomicrobiaceae bacterium]